MRALGIIFLVFALVVHPIPAYSLPATNLDVLDSLAGKAASMISGQLLKTGSDKFSISIKPAGSAWIIENPLVGALSAAGARLYTASDTSKQIILLDLSITKLGVSYLSDNNEDDTLIREFRLEASGKLLKSGEYLPLGAISLSCSDRIGRSDVSSVENPAWDFTRGVVPDNKGWFYQNILEPVIVVGSVAVAIVLLFTVRSP